MNPDKRFSLLTVLFPLLFWASCHIPNSAEKQARIRAEADTLMAYMRRNIQPLNALEKFDSTRFLLDSLRPIVYENGDPQLEGVFLRFMGGYHINTQHPDSAKPYYRKSLQLSHENKLEPRDAAAAELALARVYLQEEKMDTALSYALSAYTYAKENHTENFPKCCLRLVEIYNAVGDIGMQRKYLFEGFDATKGPDGSSNGLIRMGLASAIVGYYDMVGETDSATMFYETYLLHDSTELGPRMKADLYRDYGVRLESAGKPREALDKYNEALGLYKESRMYGYIYCYIAKAYQQLGQYPRSDMYLDTAYTLAMTEDISGDRTDIWLTRARNAHLQGLDAKAYEWHDSAFQVYKKSVELSFGTKTREMEARYEMEAKDREIQALHLAHVAAQRESAQHNTLIVALLIILLLALGFAVIFFRRNRLAVQLKQTELEQRLLRAQMEPHFIFNTLSVLQSQIRNGENQKSIKYLNKFAKLLRVSLENSREAFVPLAEEVEALENYLSLQAMRFEGVFDYSISVYDGYRNDSVEIPPMLFQPFVENAIQHGMRSKLHDGHISIHIRKEKKVLRCLIEDNGAGLSKHDKGTEKKSLSAIITQERLMALSKQSGQRASLSIKSKTDGPGTVVEMLIPYKG